MKKKEVEKFYNLGPLLKAALGCIYKIIFGERSAGKSFATCCHAISKIVKSNYSESMVVLRRREEDIRGDRSSTYLSAISSAGKIKEITKGLWDRVYYHARKFYFAKEDENGKIIKSEEPFCYIYSIGSFEHNKGTNVPNVSTIIFEEFISFDYLPQEETYLLNSISTLVRHKGPDEVEIFCLGNAMNSYNNPVFRMLGIEKSVREMKPGTIQIFTNKLRPNLKVAVEFTSPAAEKESDIFFSLSDNSGAADMITGKNGWQQRHFPHLPVGTRISLDETIMIFFIEAFDAILMGEVIVKDESRPFILIHEKTTKITDKSMKEDLIFQLDIQEVGKPNIRQNILNPPDKRGLFLKQMILQDASLFFGTDNAGEIFTNYLSACEQM